LCFTFVKESPFENKNVLLSPDGNGNPAPFFGVDCNVQQEGLLLWKKNRSAPKQKKLPEMDSF
jgi:hypothetical protein